MLLRHGLMVITDYLINPLAKKWDRVGAILDKITNLSVLTQYARAKESIDSIPLILFRRKRV